MDQKLCTAPPSDDFITSETLIKKEANLSGSTLTVTEQSSTFQTSTSKSNNDNQTTIKSSSRTELFKAKISNTFRSKNISTSLKCTTLGHPSSGTQKSQQTTLCVNKTAPATCGRRRQRPKIKLKRVLEKVEYTGQL